LLGTTWHGMDLRETGLPVAFTLRANVRPRQILDGRSKPLAEVLAPRQAVALTGRFRTVSGQRHYATPTSRWLRMRDLIMVHRRHQLPDFAAGSARWIDVSLANQYLVAYEGTKPVYATLISSGRDRLGDPETEPATPQGVFQVVAKHVSRDLDGREVEQRYELRDAPWVIDTSGGFPLCAGVWRSRFGEARGHHAIALAPVDARWLFDWVSPALPDGWHSVRGDDDATRVYVHK
jgi:hypothetical protein